MHKNKDIMSTVSVVPLDQGVDNRGNHGKIRDLYNSGKVMKKSGNFVKVSPNQRTLHFYLLNVPKKLPKRLYQKRKQEEKEMKQNLKRKKVSNTVKKIKKKKKYIYI